MTPPVLLLAAVVLVAAVLVAIVLVLAVVARRARRVRAVPPGPRTVAELVQLRGEREPARPELLPEAPGAAELPEVVAEAPPEAPAEVVPDVVVPPPERPAVTGLGTDVPWRRGALMNGGIGALAVGALDAGSGSEPEPAVHTVAVDAARPTGPTAEQTAADLALLRTFGAADLASRPDRAPDVALTRIAPPAPQPVEGPARPVRFRVVRRSGEIVAGAAVSLLDAAGREVATSTGGTGELLAPGPGSYLLVAAAAGPQAGALALCVAGEAVDTEVLLVRSAALRGTVLGEDGPVAGARITLVQDGEIVEAARADEEGTFRIDGLAAGEYAVSVAAAGCEPDVGLVTVPDEAEAVHDVELGPAGVTAGWSENV